MSWFNPRVFMLGGIAVAMAMVIVGEALTRNSAVLGLFASSKSQRSLTVLGSASVDFGEQSQGATLSHTFRLRNDSRSTVQILEFRTSCSCVATPPKTNSELSLAPGNYLEVPVSLSTGDRKSSASGALRLTYCHLPIKDTTIKPSQLELRLSATMALPYRISPEKLDFGTLTDLIPSRQARTIEIVGTLGDPLEIHDVSTTCKQLSVRLASSNPVENRHTIEVVLDAHDLVTSLGLRDVIKLSLSSKVAPRAFVEVRANYRQSVESFPPSITVGSAINGRVTERFRIKPACAAKALRLTSTDAAAISPKMLATNEDGSIDCQVEIADVSPRQLVGAIQATISLAPSGEAIATREMSVPVYRFSKEK